jgi:hypothetical protein
MVVFEFLLNFVSLLTPLVFNINFAPFLMHNSTDAAKNSLRREVEILKTEAHWSKAYFYLWDEVRHFTSMLKLVTWFYNARCRPRCAYIATYDVMSTFKSQ